LGFGWLVEAFICARWTISEMRARSCQHPALSLQVIEKKRDFSNIADEQGMMAAVPASG
jgi:hypothetical protein